MVLAAADSTLEGMLSLNVNVIEEGADDSSSQSCALVLHIGFLWPEAFLDFKKYF